MPRISIRLEFDEFEALAVLARKEHRDPHNQAAILIRRQLEQQGLLKAEKGNGTNDDAKGDSPCK